MKLISAIIVIGLTASSFAGQITTPTPATKPAAATPALSPVGEKEFEAALKEYLRVESRESAAAKAQRQADVVAGMVGHPVNFKGKLLSESVVKEKVKVEVIDSAPLRDIVVEKTRDEVTGGKIGKDITIVGEITAVKVEQAKDRRNAGIVYKAPPRITITVK